MRLLYSETQLKRTCYAMFALAFVAILSACAQAPWEHKKANNAPPETKVAEVEKQLKAEPEVS